MPSDPEHPMNPPLRAYARRRRADAGEPALHPANRRLLQAEVSRLRPAGQSGRGTRGWFWTLWPRLAFAAAVCGVLGFVLWNALHDRAGTAFTPTMAKLEPASDLKSEENQPPPTTESKVPQRLTETAAPVAATLNAVEARAGTGAARALPAAASPPVESMARESLALSSPASPPPTRALTRGGIAPSGEPVSLAASEGAAPARGRNLPTPLSPAPPLPVDSRANANGNTAASAAPVAPVVPAPTLSKVQGKDELVLQPEQPDARFVQTAPSPAAPAPAPGLAPKPATATLGAPVPAPGPAPDVDAATRYQIAGAAGRGMVPSPASRGGDASAPRALALSTSVPVRVRYVFNESAAEPVARRGTVAGPLTTFELERSGEQVRLFDGDGSIYSGMTVPTNRALFRASGTNRVSGRPVSVEGVFVQPGLGVGGVTGQSGPRFGGVPATPAPPATRPATPGTLTDRLETLPESSLQLRIRLEGAAEKRGVAVPAAK